MHYLPMNTAPFSSENCERGDEVFLVQKIVWLYIHRRTLAAYALNAAPNF